MHSSSFCLFFIFKFLLNTCYQVSTVNHSFQNVLYETKSKEKKKKKNKVLDFAIKYYKKNTRFS